MVALHSLCGNGVCVRTYTVSASIASECRNILINWNVRVGIPKIFICGAGGRHDVG